jgi:hypothetical protein
MTPTPNNWLSPKTLVAFHEAGHVVAAQHFGYTVGNVDIRQAAGPLILGQPQYEGCCGILRCGHSRTDLRIVGVAGEVAEFLALGWDDWQALDVGSFGPTDRRDLSPESLPRAIARAVEILTVRWQLVRDIAELLESDGALAPHVIAGLWRCELVKDF